MTPQIALALAIGLTASAEDLWRRQVSNWIPVTALMCGFGFHLWSEGWRGLLPAFLGAAGGFAIFLVFYMLGGMGGGDVKLMAGLGSIIGGGRLVEASIYTALIGALLACLVLGGSALLRLVRKTPGEGPKSIPYAPAIALGVLLSLVPR
jgi:prepilin peptidase CpaA